MFVIMTTRSSSAAKATMFARSFPAHELSRLAYTTCHATRGVATELPLLVASFNRLALVAFSEEVVFPVRLGSQFIGSNKPVIMGGRQLRYCSSVDVQ